jgi:tryptophan synthase beta chain
LITLDEERRGKMSLVKITLQEKEYPQKWYNVQAEMPNPMNAPRGAASCVDLAFIFPESLLGQEMSTEKWIEIPEEVRDFYQLWRPTPLYRAERLEKALDTPARIYFKYEGTNPGGSHKINTAIAQVYYNKQAGIKHLTTETGAGQWGTALSIACQFLGLDCTVYMVKVSYDQKPYRRSLMEVYGGRVIPSPSTETEAGRKVLAENPESLGSLGIAISEAVEVAASRSDTNYSLGSVLNHVALHQTVIGLEAKAQLAKIDAYPDIVIGCCGGGSNFAGIAFPFLSDVFSGKKLRAVAVEPAACPTLTKGKFAYDFGDTAGFTPLLPMYTLGHNFMPPGIHAGGLRYHGVSPLISQLYCDGLIEAKAYGQNEVFQAALLFAHQEGILPAPESSHAIKGAIDEALACRAAGESKNILFCLSGHGDFDLTAYDSYLAQKLEDIKYNDELFEQSLAGLELVK